MRWACRLRSPSSRTVFCVSICTVYYCFKFFSSPKLNNYYCGNKREMNKYFRLIFTATVYNHTEHPRKHHKGLLLRTMDIAHLFTGLITIILSFGGDAYPPPSVSQHTFIYENGKLNISGRRWLRSWWTRVARQPKPQSY